MKWQESETENSHSTLLPAWKTVIALQSSSLLSRIRNADYSLRFLVRRHPKFCF